MFSTAVRGGNPFATEPKSREVKKNILVKVFGRLTFKQQKTQTTGNNWKNR